MPVSIQQIVDFKYDLTNTPWNFNPTKEEYEKLGELQDLLADYLEYFQDRVVEKKEWEL